MIKGIKGHGYRDELVVPIIENTPYEYELTDSLAEAVCYYCPSLEFQFLNLRKKTNIIFVVCCSHNFVWIK